MTEGRQIERDEQAKKRGIYGDDLSRPKHELIDEIRRDLGRARGRLSDIMHDMPMTTERLKSAEGLLTCGISYLYYEMLEIKRWETRVPTVDGERGVATDGD